MKRTAPAKLPLWATRAAEGAAAHLYVPPQPHADPASVAQRLNGRLWTAPITPEERVTGFCRLDQGAEIEGRFVRPDQFLRCGEALAVVGWRVDTRTAPPGTVETEAARRAVESAGGPVSKRTIKHYKAEVKRELLAKAVPARRIYPVYWHLQDGWIIVGGGDKEVEEVRAALGGRCERLSDAIEPVSADTLGRIYGPARLLRAPSVPEPGKRLEDRRPSDAAWSDLLLWMRTEQGWRSWGGLWVDGLADLSREAVSVKVSDEAGATSATLAEGGYLTRLRISLMEGDVEDGESGDKYKLTLSVKEEKGLCWGGIELGIKPPEEREDADRYLDERIDAMLRLRLDAYWRIWGWLQELVSEWAVDRLDLARWTRVIAGARAQVERDLGERRIIPAPPASAGDEPAPDDRPPAAPPDDSRDDDGADSHPRQPQTEAA